MQIARVVSKRVALILAAALVLPGCRPAEPVAATAPPTVEIAIATPAGAAPMARLPGRIEPYRRAQVRARVEGIVQQRVYTEGEDVKAGQLLFRIDPAQLDVDLAAAEAELSQARSAAGAAQDILQRSKQLVEDHSISTQQYRKDYFADKQARALEQSAVAKVRSARLRRIYADVTAPIAGRARKAVVSEGTMVGQDEGTILTTVEQIDPFYVDFSQPVADFLALRKMHLAEPGPVAVAPVILRLADGTRYGTAGTLQFADSAVDPQTDTVALRAVFANPDRLLLPGMYVQVEVEQAHTGTAMLIPQRALARGRDGAYVMIEEHGAARQVAVQADRLEGDQWRVESGLRGGERVILDGAALRDGQAVTLKEPALPVASSRS
jgi:multidrug efflux system membrane fusion protein